MFKGLGVQEAGVPEIEDFRGYCNYHPNFGSVLGVQGIGCPRFKGWVVQGVGDRVLKKTLEFWWRKSIEIDK